MINILKRCYRSWQNRTYARYSEVWTQIRGETDVFGEQLRCHLQLNPDGTVDFSLDDIGKMSIKCAWCAKPILAGLPITLYTPTEPDFVIPEYAVVYKEEPLQLVGCLRMGCCDTGADRAGFWVPNTDEPEKREAHVHRVLSPLEQVIMQNNRGDDSPMIFSDLSNISTAQTDHNRAVDAHNAANLE